MTFPVSSGGFQYYLPVTEWETENLEVYVDITYRNTPGSSAICNISLIDAEKQPLAVSSAFFTSAGTDYPLENIARLFSEPKNNKLRITSALSGESFKAMLASDPITLTITLDGASYRCIPPKLFLDYKTQLLGDINYIPGRLSALSCGTAFFHPVHRHKT